MGKKVEECYFCGQLVTCDPECGCSKCIFPKKFNEWGEGSPEIREFYRRNELFYEVLFVNSKEFEHRLFDGWHKGQLAILKQYSTRVGDWTSNGFVYSIEDDPEIQQGYRINELYYEQKGIPSDTHNGPFHCQICGTSIANRTSIECARLHTIVLIGTDCGKNFRFAEEMYKQMKSDIEAIIRRDFELNLRSMKKEKDSLLARCRNKTERNKIENLVKRMMYLNRKHPPSTTLVLVHNLQRAEKLGFTISLMRKS